VREGFSANLARAMRDDLLAWRLRLCTEREQFHRSRHRHRLDGEPLATRQDGQTRTGQIQALTTQLFTLTTSKAPAGVPAPVTKRARSREATNRPSRAS